MIVDNVVAIDPGKSGGIAWISAGETGAMVMPLTKGGELDTNAVFELLVDVDPDIIIIERQRIIQGQGVTSSGTTMMNYGKLLACAELYPGTDLITPTPQQWQKQVLGNFPKGQSKLYSVAKAKELYPAVSLLRTPRCTKPHDGMADALCMLSYIPKS